jgi:hypothetical protein
VRSLTAKIAKERKVPQRNFSLRDFALFAFFAVKKKEARKSQSIAREYVKGTKKNPALTGF